MSEYDAGTLPPICPQCRKWERVEWEECPEIATDKVKWRHGQTTPCDTCGGDGGWFVCRDCGFGSRELSPSSRAPSAERSQSDA